MEPSTSFSLLDVHSKEDSSSSTPPPIVSINTTGSTTTTTTMMDATFSSSRNKRPIISTTETTATTTKGQATAAVATSYYDKGSVELAIETPVMLQRLEKRRKLTGTGANNTDGEFLLIVLVSVGQEGRGFVNNNRSIVSLIYPLSLTHSFLRSHST
jgi:hypothetical protein